MIKQLKRNFVIMNMTLISIILITIFIILLSYTYSKQKEESYDILSNVILYANKDKTFQWNLDSKPQISEYHKKPSPTSALRTFIIELDENGQVIKIINEKNLDISDDNFIEELASYCLSQDKTQGIIKEKQLRYMIRTKDNITRIGFIDRSNELNSIYTLIQSSVIVLTIALSAFFMISIFLAKRMVKPIEVSLTLQQQFIANASHELKTPLAIMLANLDIIDSHPNDPIASQQKWINYLRHEIKRISSLVSQMLYLAKAESNSSSSVLCSVNLSKLLESCYLPFESIAYENKKILSCDIPSDVILSYADPNQLIEVFTILIDNALKYSNTNGSVLVKLYTYNGKAHIEINNTTDHPIEDKHKKRIFERFYRIDESHSSEQGGTGLGLSIAESIVTAHHGKISVQSSLKEGTTFSVVLPLV